MMARLMYEKDHRWGRYPYVVQPADTVDPDTMVAVLLEAMVMHDLDTRGSVVLDADGPEFGVVRACTYAIAYNVRRAIKELL